MFKHVHSETEKLRNSGFSTSDIKNDIKHMEEEKSQLERRVQRLRQKVSEYSAFFNLLLKLLVSCQH